MDTLRHIKYKYDLEFLINACTAILTTEFTDLYKNVPRSILKYQLSSTLNTILVELNLAVSVLPLK